MSITNKRNNSFKHSFVFPDIENNGISPIGMNHFSKAAWNNLTVLRLSIYNMIEDQNCISDLGCKYLSSAQMPQLK